MSAIRARLARKSLPLVSADGLVMYGLQISPTVQIAAGKIYLKNIRFLRLSLLFKKCYCKNEI